jgi:hypothetical protein
MMGQFTECRNLAGTWESPSGEGRVGGWVGWGGVSQTFGTVTGWPQRISHGALVTGRADLAGPV